MTAETRNQSGGVTLCAARRARRGRPSEQSAGRSSSEEDAIAQIAPMMPTDDRNDVRNEHDQAQQKCSSRPMRRSAGRAPPGRGPETGFFM